VKAELLVSVYFLGLFMLCWITVICRFGLLRNGSLVDSVPATQPTSREQCESRDVKWT